PDANGFSFNPHLRDQNKQAIRLEQIRPVIRYTRGMYERVRAMWQENRAGLAGSVALHLLFLAITLWWGVTHPINRQPPLKAMLVDLVARPVPAPGPSGGSHAVVRAPLPAAPKTTGVRPK